MKQKDILFISLWTFIVVAAWIGFSLYHTWVTTTITPELQIAIQPIAPNFDTATIATLRSRERVSPLYQLQSTGVKPSPTPTPEPIVTGAQAEPTPSISGPNIPTIAGQ